MRQKGFTLIELMVAISITAVLGTLSIVGFVNYNQNQVLQASTSEVVSMLNLAKSRAQSQIKLGINCKSSDQPLSDRTLVDYRVDISQVDRSYSLYIDCRDSTLNDFQDEISAKTLPTGLGFGATASYFFPVQTGGATAGTIVISNASGGSAKTIFINALGGVSVE